MGRDLWKRLQAFFDEDRQEAAGVVAPPAPPKNDDRGAIADAVLYHYEYQAIHNQRIASGRLIHIWYQIAFASSPLIFAQVLSLAKNNDTGKFTDGPLMVAAVLAGIAPLGFSLSFVFWYLDRAIVQFYPRLLALEIMLGFQFWRQYLRDHQQVGYVESCETEAAGAVSAADLWERVRRVPLPKLPPEGRGHRIPMWTSILVGFFYVVVVSYLSGAGNVVWQWMFNCLSK